MPRTAFKGEALTHSGLCHVVEGYIVSEFTLSTPAARGRGLRGALSERYW